MQESRGLWFRTQAPGRHVILSRRSAAKDLRIGELRILRPFADFAAQGDVVSQPVAISFTDGHGAMNPPPPSSPVRGRCRATHREMDIRKNGAPCCNTAGLQENELRIYTDRLRPMADTFHLSVGLLPRLGSAAAQPQRSILRTLLLLVASFALPLPLRAVQPGAGDLVILRATGTAADKFETGLSVFNPRTKEFSHWVDVPYVPPVAGSRSPLALSTVDERVLLQGADYYEFEIATGRLMRRYSALDAALGGWALHGVTVSVPVASALGLPSGTYGFPFCPRVDFGSRCAIPPQPFPGYSQRGVIPLTDPGIVLFRGIKPEATSLQLAATLPRDADPAYASRFLSLDGQRRGIWSWAEYTPAPGFGVYQRVGFIPIEGERFGSEEAKNAWQSWNASSPSKDRNYTHAFTYLPADDSFYVTLANAETQTFSFFRIPAASPSLLSRELIEDGAVAGRTQNDAITPLPYILPATFVQMIPAVGEGPGAHSTYWRSDVYLFNPSEESTPVTVRRVSRPERLATYVIQPRGSLKITNALRQLGGGPAPNGGDGIQTDALVVEAHFRSGKQLSVYSRTYTTASSGGTYGQAVPSVPTTIGYSTHGGEFRYPDDLASMVSTLILDKRHSDQYRHNIGVVNDGDTAMTVRLRFDLASTLPPDPLEPDDERSFTVAPHSVANVAIESLFPLTIFHERPPRLWIAATRPAAIWLSIVDNITGDATFVPFSLFTLRGGMQTAAIPAVASTEGANGTHWRTDMYGLFLPTEAGDEAQSPSAWFHPSAGTTCSTTAFRVRGVVGADGVSENLPPYYRSVFADIGSQACPEGTVLGAVELRVASWMSAFTRTYTTNADGGTLGEMLPLYPSDGWQQQHFAGVEQRAGFRINIGLYNGLSYAVRNRLFLYGADGKLAGEVSVPLSAHESSQWPIGTLFGTIDDGVYALSVVPEADDGQAARTWAYISTIDNVTGDPTNWW